MKGRKLFSKILSLLMVMTMVLGISGKSAFKTYATGNGEVITGKYLIMQHYMTKTVDLADTGVDVSITQAERDEILKEARKDAAVFINKRISKDGIKNIEWITADDIYKVARIGKDMQPEMFENNELILEDGSVVPLFYQAQYIFDKDGAMEFVEEATGEYEKDKDENNTYYQEKADELNELLKEAITEFKAQEIYNNEIGDLFISRLGNQLDAKFEFVLEPIKDDGSEDSTYGVDGKNIMRGILKSDNTEMPFSTVDFSQNEVYDEILQEDIENIVEGKGYKNGITTLSNICSDFFEFRPRDGREVITHSLVFDKGQLFSSDDSQYSYGENLKRSKEDGWSGTHSLLEISDSLTAYDIFFPLWSYVQTFNLHLNPAVTYIAGDVKADMISSAEFDSNGKVLSISKPLIPADGKIGTQSSYLDSILQNAKNYVDASNDGTYRFKLVEKSATPETLPNGSTFNENTEVKIVDITVSGGEIQAIEMYENVDGYNKVANSTGLIDSDYVNALPKFTNKVTPKEEPKTEEPKEEPKTEEPKEEPKTEEPKEEPKTEPEPTTEPGTSGGEDVTTVPTDTEVEDTNTEVETGKVIVSYEDTDENKLRKDIVLEGNVGEAYETEELKFDEYTLTETRGDVKGVYEADTKEVKYIYEKSAGGAGEGDNTSDNGSEVADDNSGSNTKVKSVKTGDYAMDAALLMAAVLLGCIVATGVILKRRSIR